MDKRIDCDELAELIDAYVDGELTRSDRDAFERHVAGCPACAGAVAETRAASASVRSLGRYPAPPGIVERVRATLDVEAGRGLRPRAPTFSRRFLVMSHIGAAAAGAVAMVLWFAQPPKTDPLADAVGGHIRVLLNEQHKSVASNDSHVVRPWFAGKIDFAPRVPELGAAGFPLLGGRVDTLRRRTAAAILYGRREHRITLLVSPNETRAPREPTSGSERGYHAIGWADAEFVYWVVSDLNPRELAEFADLARDAVAGGAKPASDPRS